MSRSAAVLGIVMLAGFAAWTGWRAWNTEGFLEADEVLHFLYARDASSVPTNFVHPWARPIGTALVFPFAKLGWPWPRMLSVIAGAAAAGFSFLASRALGWRTAACAVPFTFAQPLFFQQTAGVWTEIVFAAFFGAWMLALVSARPKTLAAIAAVLPLVRPEGFWILAVTAVLAALRFRRDRQGVVFLILPLGVAVWWLAGLVLGGSAGWVLAHWPRNWAPSASYGHGSWTWLLDALPAVVPVALLPLAALGCFAPGGKRAWPVVIAVVAVLGLHGALWAAGAFGSAGYPRYFVTMAPAFGMLIAGGVEVIARAVRGVPAAAWTAAAGVAAVVLLLWHPTATVRPPMPPDGRLFAALGKWIRTQDPDPALLSLHPFAYLELPHVPADHFDEFSSLDAKRLAMAAPGTWLLDEDRFLKAPASELAAAGYQRVAVPDLGVDLSVDDPRHDQAIEHMEWSLWRKAGR